MTENTRADEPRYRAGNHPERSSQNGLGSAKSTNVLVVDDDPISRSIVRDQLSARGFQVDACGGARAALDLIRRRPYDLLIVDIFLPHRDGRSLHTSVLALNPELARRTIFISHWEPAGPIAEYIGENGLFLKKPFSAEDLMNGIALATRGIAGDIAP
jgi:DNA-binding response OmpR family regulator